MSGDSNIDEGVNNFANILYDSAFQIFGQVERVKASHSNTQHKYISHWFTHECEVARAELNLANKAFRKYRTHDLQEVLVEKRTHYNKIKRRARFIYNQNKKQSCMIWLQITLKHFGVKYAVCRGVMIVVVTCDCKIFSNHFKEVFSENCDFTQDFVENFVSDNLSGNNSEATNENQNLDTSSRDALISVEEVKKAASHLKSNKSPDIDLLPPELFLDSVDLIGNMLCKLFNHIFSNSIYPESWTKGIVKKVIKMILIITGT